MLNIIMTALKDSLLLVPFLLVIYFVIAWLEYKYSNSIQNNIRKAGKAGPLLGALFGCIPQCGFSVVGSALYTRRFITTGTLIAVFISTSDEALPVIMANPSRIGLIMPLLLTKVVIALIAGYLIDTFFYKKIKVHDTKHCKCHIGPTGKHIHIHAVEEKKVPEIVASDNDEPVEIDACCGHHLPAVNKMRTLIMHPLRHTAQVFIVLFIISIVINYLVGEEGANLGKFLLKDSIWQPIVAAFVGLIPNCGASVAITEIYLKGGISFGAVIAGLSSSAGLGLMVLLKENHNPKDTLRILGLLLAFSISAGIIIQFIEPYINVSWIK
jgi:hypothetical protein